MKPWERLTSEQAAVDWFCFWRKRAKNPDPGKTERYMSLARMHKLQQNEKR